MHLKDKLPKASYTKDFRGILGKKAPEQSKSMVLPLQTLKISKTIETDLDPDSARLKDRQTSIKKKREEIEDIILRQVQQQNKKN